MDTSPCPASSLSALPHPSSSSSSSSSYAVPYDWGVNTLPEMHVRRVIYKKFIRGGWFNQKDVSGFIGSLCHASYAREMVEMILKQYARLEYVHQNGPHYSISRKGVDYFNTAKISHPAQPYVPQSTVLWSAQPVDTSASSGGGGNQFLSDSLQKYIQTGFSRLPAESMRVALTEKEVVITINKDVFLSWLISNPTESGLIMKV